MEASASIKKKAILNKEDSGFLSTSKLSPVVSQKPANNFSVFRQFGKKQPSPVLPPIQRNFDSKWRWLQAFRNKRRPLVPVQEVIHDDSFITEETTKKQEDKTETIGRPLSIYHFILS